ncbi:phage major capsid protein [Nonomuraea africana]|uniref:HK97 family phage major capsid protein n=1 Tax=Nonomuraea africana TaxID=46171 RepID=A0ABR9K8W1_9ACTN|nr:phage major capsid protein [Nonomuraea africana]MBE1558255.1 HK97 family phage major capsid protein [Nonomuraea africana]
MIERAFSANQLPDYAAERATALVTTGSNRDQDLASRWIMVTGDENYRSAFAKLCGDPERGHLLWDNAESDAFRTAHSVQMEMRAMSLTDASGGYMVPFTLDPAIILTNPGTINPLRTISRVVQTVTDSWAGVTSAGVSAEWLAEATEAADASPTLAQPSIPVHKGAAFIPYSYEVGMDAGAGFLDELGALLQDGASRLQSIAYTTGTGTGQPKGIVTALDGSVSEVAPTTAETFSSPDVYKVKQALSPRWQANAQWLASGAIMDSIDQLETGNGAKKFPGVGEATPTLLRKPIWETSDMDSSINPAATADNHVLIYGDFSQFVIVDRIGTTIELIPNLFGANRRPTGQRGAFMWFRTGSDVTTVNAFRMLNVATTA